MDPISADDVKARVLELPEVSVLQSDHRLFVDSPTLRGGQVAPGPIVARANVDIPISPGNPPFTATVLLLEGNQLKKYTVGQTLGDDNQWYLGPFSVPPSVSNQGAPLVPGHQYFNTTDRQVYIWVGSGEGQGWQLYGVPYPANSQHYYYYFAVPTGVVTGADQFGNTLLMNPAEGDDIGVYLNGTRLLYNIDFTVVGNDEVHLAGEACGNSVCEIIVQKRVTLDYTVTPFAVNTELWVPDGTNHTFPIIKYGGGLLTPGSSLNTLLCKNGLLLDPVHQYRTMGSNVIFVDAPLPGERFWMTVGLPIIPDYLENAVNLASQAGSNNLHGTFMSDGNGLPVTFG